MGSTSDRYHDRIAPLYDSIDYGVFDLALAQGDALSLCEDAEAGFRAPVRVLRRGGQTDTTPNVDPEPMLPYQ